MPLVHTSFVCKRVTGFSFTLTVSIIKSVEKMEREKSELHVNYLWVQMTIKYTAWFFSVLVV